MNRPRKRTPGCPEDRRAHAGRVRIDSRALPAALSNLGSKLAEGLLAVNGVATLNVVEALVNHSVNFLRGVFLAEVPRDDVVIDCSVQELVWVRRTSGFDFILDDLLKLGFQGDVRERWSPASDRTKLILRRGVVSVMVRCSNVYEADPGRKRRCCWMPASQLNSCRIYSTTSTSRQESALLQGLPLPGSGPRVRLAEAASP